MRKILISVILAVIVSLFLTGAVIAAADVKISEVPDIKIVMDGRITKYNDVPLIIQGRTMLPLRELLVNLGVPNDDEHIIYNGQEKSVTIIKEGTCIYLKAGDKTAYVNGESFELDAAPIIYRKNSRTYIPLRFVAEALEMKVVWEGKSRSVFLCSIDKYESMKELLQKYDDAMLKAEKYKQRVYSKTTFKSSGESKDFIADVEIQIDKSKKRRHLKGIYDIFGIRLEGEEYLSGDKLYTLNPLSGKWEKEILEQREYDELFTEKSNEMVVISDDVLCAGLNQVPSEKPDEILLKGDACLTDLLMRVFELEVPSLPIRQMKIKAFNVEMSLNADTFLPNFIIMNANAEIPADEGITNCNMHFRLEYDFNEELTIEVPEDIVESAVETEKTS